MRCGADLKPIADQLRDISCHVKVLTKEGKILSCADALSKAILKYLAAKKEDEKKKKEKTEKEVVASTVEEKPKAEPVLVLKSGNGFMGACPECGGQVQHESGCVICHSCGYSRC